MIHINSSVAQKKKLLLKLHRKFFNCDAVYCIIHQSSLSLLYFPTDSIVTVFLLITLSVALRIIFIRLF